MTRRRLVVVGTMATHPYAGMASARADSLWKSGPPSRPQFTTVCNWKQEGHDVEAVSTDCELHSRAARDIAGEYFAAERVLPKLLQDIGL